MRRWLYFIQVASGPVKIGITGDLSERLKGIQIYNHERVTLIRSIPEATYKMEMAYHTHYADQHLHGEWFNFCPTMLDLELAYDARPGWKRRYDERKAQ